MIDTVEPAKCEELVENLGQLKLKRLDYIIANHAEQDHSGSIPRILGLYPQAKVVTNAKCRDYLTDFLHLPAEKFQVVADRQTLSLGDKTLEFILAPWVHWPETMFTYLQEEQVLFTCDFFGAHLAASSLFAADQAEVYREAKSYYAQIMMPYARTIRAHIDTVATMNVRIAAPSHGPVHDNPSLIIEAYREWADERPKNEVLLGYASMHGSTEKMALALIDGLLQHNIAVKPFNLVSANIGDLATAAVDCATICLATPAFLVGPHPSVVYAAYLLNALKPKAKFLAVLGSYSWGSKMVEQLAALLSGIKAEMLAPVLAKGMPRPADLEAVRRLAGTIAEKHRAAAL